MKFPGIYRITVLRGENPSKFYIGQAVNIHKRRLHHLNRLSHGKSSNPAMQQAFNRYGPDSFIFEVLTQSTDDSGVLTTLEQEHLDEHLGEYGESRMYNVLVADVSSRRGLKASDETRVKMSAARKGRKLSPEQVANMSAAMMGHKLSPESIAKRTLKQKGIKRSDETKAKISASQTGRVMSDEAKAKISATKKARNQRPSEEHMMRLNAINTGRQMPDHVREALRNSQVGRVKSPEEIAKRSATRKANAALREKNCV